MDETSSKKPLGRKKLVDLKAVAALLEDDPTLPQPASSPKQPVFELKLDEDFIQETSRIKSQRDVIQKRIQRMEQNKERVSPTVFQKVRRDYTAQFESITHLFEEKKAVLQKELKNLYLLREKQVMEVNRHKEILEEANFRHYLDEFSEEQYTEVEEFETREISKLEEGLAQINSYIRIHEEFFDPRDSGGAPPSFIKPQASEVTRTVQQRTAPPQAPAPVAPSYTPPTALPPVPTPEREPVREKAPAIQPRGRDDFADKTPPAAPVESISSHDEEMALGEAQKEAALNKAPAKPSQDLSLDDYGLGEPHYFQAEEPTSPTPEATAKSEDAPSRKEASYSTEPQSIFDVLEEKNPAPEAASPSRPAASMPPAPVEPVPAPIVPPVAATAAGLYKMIMIEGPDKLDIKEFTLKDNVSIGRSPSNDLMLTSPKVSRQHAAINKYKDQYILIDLKSSNGVFVNGRKIDEKPLQEGDEVSIGGYRMIFKKV